MFQYYHLESFFIITRVHIIKSGTLKLCLKEAKLLKYTFALQATLDTFRDKVQISFGGQNNYCLL